MNGLIWHAKLLGFILCGEKTCKHLVITIYSYQCLPSAFVASLVLPKFTIKYRLCDLHDTWLYYEYLGYILVAHSHLFLLLAILLLINSSLLVYLINIYWMPVIYQICSKFRDSEWIQFLLSWNLYLSGGHRLINKFVYKSLSMNTAYKVSIRLNSWVWQSPPIPLPCLCSLLLSRMFQKWKTKRKDKGFQPCH